MDEIQDQEATVFAGEPVVIERKKPGPKPGFKKIITDTNPPTSGKVEPVTLGGSETIGHDFEQDFQERKLAESLEEDFGTLVDIDRENLTFGYQSLGKFAPPKGFDLQKYAVRYGIEDAGALDGWPSVAELLQPEPYSNVGKILPPWKVWKNPSTGQPHKVELGKTRAVLCYQPRANTDALEKSFGDLSKNEIKGINNKIGQYNKNLPAEVENDFQREEDMVLGEIARSSQ